VKAFGTLGAESLAAEAYRDPGLVVLFSMRSKRTGGAGDVGGGGDRMMRTVALPQQTLPTKTSTRTGFTERILLDASDAPGHAESQVRQQIARHRNGTRYPVRLA